MTAPRSVVPGRFIFITRRCTQRQFILRPDQAVGDTYTYCLAEAVARFGVIPILSQMEANHHHTAIYDPHGREVEFREHFHKMTAKSINALRGRWENLWACEEPCVIEVVTVEDLLDKLTYIATNPVKDGLVDKVHHWPGPNFVRALLTGRAMKTYRPKHFFRENGSMPAELDLLLRLPDHFEGKAKFLADLRERIAEVERACARERELTQRRVIGRRRILERSWRDSPTSQEPRRGLRPRVAARHPWIRIKTLQRNKQWQVEYRAARIDWLAGLVTMFPFGTYWLSRFANVPVKPPLPIN
jgi:REP element-mobilizing transposase RayT